MNKRWFPLIILLLLLVTSCKSKKRSVSSKKSTETEKVVIKDKGSKVIVQPNEKTTGTKKPGSNAPYAEVVTFYIDTYSDIAMHEMLQYGIPASITLAQGILEAERDAVPLPKRPIIILG